MKSYTFKEIKSKQIIFEKLKKWKIENYLFELLQQFIIHNNKWMIKHETLH